MTAFEKPMPPFRLAEILPNDTLQAIAARELGDARLWSDLVWINGLLPPYLTADPQLASETVLLVGTLIRIPSAVGMRTEETDLGRVYGADCHLTQRLLSVDATGDLAVVSGTRNLRQQLEHRIVTPLGQARYHPDYGCKIWKLLGTVQGPTAPLMGAAYVRTALLSDYRIRAVASVRAEVADGAVRVTATAEATAGQAVEVVTP